MDSHKYFGIIQSYMARTYSCKIPLGESKQGCLGNTRVGKYQAGNSAWEIRDHPVNTGKYKKIVKSYLICIKKS